VNPSRLLQAEPTPPRSRTRPLLLAAHHHVRVQTGSDQLERRLEGIRLHVIAHAGAARAVDIQIAPVTRILAPRAALTGEKHVEGVGLDVGPARVVVDHGIQPVDEGRHTPRGVVIDPRISEAGMRRARGDVVAVVVIFKLRRSSGVEGRFTGDSPGFPITFTGSAPARSYRLTSDLAVGVAGPKDLDSQN
jgi:hypothetical protein